MSSLSFSAFCFVRENVMHRFIVSLAALGFASVLSAAQLRIATVAPEGTAYLKELRAAGEAIKTQTQGRVELKFFPGGVMGTDAATVLRKIKLGQLHGGAFSGTELSAVSNDGAIFGLPYFFDSKAEFDYVLAKTGELVRKSYEKGGMVVPGFCGGGYAYLLSTKPLSSLEDLRKTKVWAPTGDPIAEVGFKIAGASTVPLPIADVYPSLQTGLVETVGGPLAAIIGFQWHTKVKYMADVPLAVTTGFLALDKRAYDKLPAPDQTIVSSEIDKAFKRLNESSFDDAASRAALIKQGIQVQVPTKEQVDAWRMVGTQSLDVLRKQNAFTPAVLEAVLAARAEFRSKQ
jgi:TRAP-type transport system periplasmic protein